VFNAGVHVKYDGKTVLSGRYSRTRRVRTAHRDVLACRRDFRTHRLRPSGATQRQGPSAGRPLCHARTHRAYDDLLASVCLIVADSNRAAARDLPASSRFRVESGDIRWNWVIGLIVVVGIILLSVGWPRWRSRSKVVNDAFRTLSVLNASFTTSPRDFPVARGTLLASRATKVPPAPHGRVHGQRRQPGRNAIHAAVRPGPGERPW